MRVGPQGPQAAGPVPVVPVKGLIAFSRVIAWVVPGMCKRNMPPGVATRPSGAGTFLTDFLRLSAGRGLRGVKLVIADSHKGLRVAARRVFNATGQRCRIHWIKKALAHAPARQRAASVAMPKTVFAQKDQGRGRSPAEDRA